MITPTLLRHHAPAVARQTLLRAPTRLTLINRASITPRCLLNKTPSTFPSLVSRRWETTTTPAKQGRKSRMSRSIATAPTTSPRSKLILLHHTSLPLPRTHQHLPRPNDPNRPSRHSPPRDPRSLRPRNLHLHPSHLPRRQRPNLALPGRRPGLLPPLPRRRRQRTHDNFSPGPPPPRGTEKQNRPPTLGGKPYIPFRRRQPQQCLNPPHPIHPLRPLVHHAGYPTRGPPTPAPVETPPREPRTPDPGRRERSVGVLGEYVREVAGSVFPSVLGECGGHEAGSEFGSGGVGEGVGGDSVCRGGWAGDEEAEWRWGGTGGGCEEVVEG